MLCRLFEVIIYFWYRYFITLFNQIGILCYKWPLMFMITKFMMFYWSQLILNIETQL